MDAKYEPVSLHQKNPPLLTAHSRQPSQDDDDDLDDDLDDLHSSSSTAADESLLGDEPSGTAKWQARSDGESGRPNRQPLSWRRTAVSSLHWGLDTILLFAILGLVVRQQLLQPKTAPPSSQLGDVGSDCTGVGPQIDRQITRFQSDQSYAPMNMSDFFRDEVLHQWNKLMPVGMGFVWVNDTHRYHDLPHPIDWPEKTVFTTSVTHQIHCLFTIAQTYAGLTTGHPLPPDHHWHMVHCIDYMREAVLCSADMALEGHETTFPDDNGGSDGWDSTHVCRDYNQVKSYLESVRAYDDQLIY